MANWVAIAETEGGEAEEVEAEKDGSLLLATVTALHAGVSTLKYRGPAGGWRIVRCIGGVLTPPETQGWGDTVYTCVKRRQNGGLASKRRRTEGYNTEEEDLDPMDYQRTNAITCVYKVWGALPLTEDKFEHKFLEYGKVSKVILKEGSGSQHGSAFISFEDPDIPMTLYGQEIDIDGISLKIKEPETEEKDQRKVVIIFRNEKITEEELRQHFEKYGRVTDVYVPQPFKFFGFVTFAKFSVCKSLYGEVHHLNGTELRLQQPRRSAKQALMNTKRIQSEMARYGIQPSCGGGYQTGGYVGNGSGFYDAGQGYNPAGYGSFSSYGGGFGKPSRGSRGGDRGGRRGGRGGHRGGASGACWGGHRSETGGGGGVGHQGGAEGGGRGGSRGNPATNDWKAMIESFNMG